MNIRKEISPDSPEYAEELKKCTAFVVNEIHDKLRQIPNPIKVVCAIDDGTSTHTMVAGDATELIPFVGALFAAVVLKVHANPNSERNETVGHA